MTANLSSVKSGMFYVWAHLGFALMFSILIWHPSRSAAMNLVDGLFLWPALMVSLYMLYRSEVSWRTVLLAALPLWLFIFYGFVSMLWADQPNVTRSSRMAIQLIALYFFVAALWSTRRQEFLKSLVWTGVLTTSLVCLWHIVLYFGFGDNMQFASGLYHAPHSRSLSLGLNPLKPIHAALLVVPQIAMLAALTLETQSRPWRWLGLVAIMILTIYVILLEQRTGLVALAAMIISALLVTRTVFWGALFALFATAVGLILVFEPDTILARGLSWRPELWWSSFVRTLQHAPYLGFGLAYTMDPVVIDHPDAYVLKGFVLHPHNMALSVFHYMGAIGVVLWINLWIRGVGQLFFSERRRHDLWLTIPLVTGLVAMIFDGGYAFSPFDYDWFAFWFPVVMLIGARIRPEPPGDEFRGATGSAVIGNQRKTTSAATGSGAARS